MAATLVTPDRGRVVVAGTDTGALTPAAKAELRREHIGIVFQQPNLLPSLSAAEQVQVMAHLSGRSPKAVRGRAWNCSTRWASRTWPGAGRTSCRAASGSASTSRGRW